MHKDNFKWNPRPKIKRISKTRWEVTELGEADWGGYKVVIPVGWDTDLATVPNILQWLVPRDGSHGYAAMVHDRLLESGYKRSIARKWMREALRHDHKQISWWRIKAMYGGVWFYDLWDKYVK